MRKLDRLFRPKSIAIFGGGWSTSVVQQCQKMGFKGDIWPVHPKLTEMAGLPCYASVADLPGAPDASFIGVNRNATIDIVRDLSARGAGGAVCFASGFREVADGAELQDQLIEAAGDMPILGPNCYGFINYVEGALLWPDQHGGRPVERGAAIIAQSSNIAINLTMQRRGLPLAYVMTVGNQAQTSLANMIEALIDDPAVTSIGLYIEGLGDIAALEGALRRAHEKRIPVVALKSGRSEAAQAMTLSHTASLAGADELVSEFLARMNVARVKSLDEMVETLKLVHVLGPSKDFTVGSLGVSGGEASLIGDLIEDTDLVLRPLTSDEAAKVKATLHDMVTISNPLDYHTFSWHDPAALEKTYAAMMSCDYGLTILIFDTPRSDRCEDNGSAAATEAAIRAAQATGGRLAMISSLPENTTEELAERLVSLGIAPLCGLQTGVKAAEYAARIGQGFQKPLPQPVLLPTDGGAAGTLEVVNEYDSKRLLKAAGIQIPESQLVQTVDEAVAAGETLGYPVVLKAVSSDLAHKTEMGAVKLNLRDADQLRDAAQMLSAFGVPMMVERMVQGGVAELILGVVRDAQFGPYLTVGLGGIMVELFKDARVMLLPVDRQAVRAALMSLKAAPLLTGFRGRPAADLEAVIDAVIALAGFVQANAATIEEIDVNPLIVCEKGAFAADALIRRRSL